MVPWNSSRISWLLPQISEFPTLIEDNFIVKPQDLLWLFIIRFVCFSLIKGCIKFSYELMTLSKVQLKKVLNWFTILLVGVFNNIFLKFLEQN